MPTLTLSVSINVTPGEEKDLAEAIGCPKDELVIKLTGYAQAALTEYTAMMLGEATISTATEVRERRLVGIIEKGCGGRIPDVARVARLFSITPSAARALLRAVTSKHRRRLDASLKAEVAEFVNACAKEPGDTDYRVTVLNPVLIELLNARLENAKARKAAITRDSQALGRYTVPEGSFEWIRDNQ